MGVELDRKRARDEGAGGWWRRRRHCSSHAKTWRRRKCCRCRRSTVREARPSTGPRRAEGPKDFGGLRKRVTVSSCPLCAPEPWRISRQECGWESCSKSWERWRRGVSQKCPPSQRNRTSSVTWSERGRTKEDTTLEAVDGATFYLSSKLELRLCIWSHIGMPQRGVWTHCLAVQVNSNVACGVVPQRAQMESEDHTSTDHSLFFLSFESESFLNKSCFPWGFQWCKLVQLAIFFVEAGLSQGGLQRTTGGISF